MSSSAVAEDSGQLMELLEAATHHILFLRRAYPPELFRCEQLYGVPVQRSRHPDLNDYIGTSLAGLRPLIESGAVQRLALVLRGPGGTPAARVVFDFEARPFLPPVHHAVVVSRPDAAAQMAPVAPGPPDAAAAPLDAVLRSLLLRLSYLGQPPPAGTAPQPPLSPESPPFEFVAYSSEAADPGNVWAEDAGRRSVLEIPVPVGLTPIKSSPGPIRAGGRTAALSRLEVYAETPG